MNPARRRSGFTLIEVLIVVIIMAVLAATIIPQFASSTKDAKESNLKFNTHTLRSQIEMYKVHHLGSYPAVTNNLEALTKRTNAGGTVSPANGTPADYPYGPYIDQIPTNPANGLNTVVAGTEGAGDGTSGWKYDAATGGIWPNHKATDMGN